MIVIWKQEGPLLHRAEWMNMRLVLAWAHNHWRVWVNGDRTKQRYDSVEAAKAGVDAVVLKLLNNGPIVPVGPERPKLTMQGLASIMASMAIVRLQHAAESFGEPVVRTQVGHIGCSKPNFLPQSARSGRVVGGVEVERA